MINCTWTNECPYLVCYSHKISSLLPVSVVAANLLGISTQTFFKCVLIYFCIILIMQISFLNANFTHTQERERVREEYR